MRGQSPTHLSPLVDSLSRALGWHKCNSEMLASALTYSPLEKPQPSIAASLKISSFMDINTRQKNRNSEPLSNDT